MHRNSAPDHFIGPGGDIYTLVSKSYKHDLRSNNRKKNKYVSEMSDDNDDEASDNVKYNGHALSNIYEIVDANDFIARSATPPVSPPPLQSSSSPPKEEMTSEEEAKLQDLLSDLLGMATDLCGMVKERGREEGARTNDTMTTSDVTKHIEPKSIKTSSSDSGFHQQFSHEDETGPSIHPPSIPSPSVLPSISISSSHYSELKLSNHQHKQQLDYDDDDDDDDNDDDDEADSNRYLNKEKNNLIQALKQELSSSLTPNYIISMETENLKPSTSFMASSENQQHGSDVIDAAKEARDVIADDIYEASPNRKYNFIGLHFTDLDLSRDMNQRHHHHSSYCHYLHDFHRHDHHRHHVRKNYNDAYDVITPATAQLDENTCTNCGMLYEDHNDHMCCERRGDDDDYKEGGGYDDDSMSMPVETSESINSLVSTPYANTQFGYSSSSSLSSSMNGRMENRRNKGRKKLKEKEVVTLEPIGIGVQLLETERNNLNTTKSYSSQHHLHQSDNIKNYNNTDNMFRSHHPNIRSPIHPSDDPFHTSTVKLRAPLVKSISSGYHRDRAPTPASQWDDVLYYSPQPQRNHLETFGSRQHYKEDQFLQSEGHQNHPSNGFLSQTFRQNTNNNNRKLPARLRPKFNSNFISVGYHGNGDVNNNDINIGSYYDTNVRPQLKHTTSVPCYPSSLRLDDDFTSFRTIRPSPHTSPYPSLASTHSLQVRNVPPDVGFEAASSRMPHSMRLITTKYHQISEPQLFRNVAIDSNMNPLDVVATPCFVTDQSKRWYHPIMSREQAIRLLLNKPAGSFIIRNSNSFDGAYGLVMKVDKLPQQVTSASPCEYIRHFLIETTTAGVQIRGSPLEPTFGSLSTLVYQHMLTPLSLPCLLVLNRYDDDFNNKIGDDVADDISQVIEETFYYVNSECTEGLTGQVAMSKVIGKTFNSVCLSQFKVTKVKLRLDAEGLILTDIERKIFFRKKYSWDYISYSGIDNSPKMYFARNEDQSKIILGRLICIVARSNALAKENTCHILASLRTNDHSFINVVEAINDRIPASSR